MAKKKKLSSQGEIPSTGWVPHIPDSRDVTFAEAVPFLGDLPEEYDTQDLVPDYQNGIGKCVLESYSYLSRLQDYYETGEDKAQSADAGYLIAKEVYDHNRAYGTSLLSGAKVAVEWGFPEEDIFPDDERFWGEPDKYFDINRWTHDVRESAAIHRKRAYVRVGGLDFGNITPEEIKEAIYQRKGVVIALRGNNEFLGAGTGFVKSPSVLDSRIWYHAIVLKGWKLFNGILHFKMANWWAQDGAFNGNGFGWLKFNEWQPHIWGGFTTVDALNDEFVKKTQMAKLYRSLLDHNEIYALNEGFRSHVANAFTLREGAKIKYWLWKEGEEIPVATDGIWNATVEMSETVHSPQD